MKHGLRGVELRNRWEDTARITSEENDVAGMIGRQTWNLGVRNVLDGIGTTGVLSQGWIIVIDYTSLGVEDDVLEDGTKLDGVEDIGLFLSWETNALGVALKLSVIFTPECVRKTYSTLDIENAVITPAVLVVANQSTVRISWQRGFASSWKTKENSDIAILAFIGRGVESQNIVLDWHLIEENGKNTLLHLASVLGTEDNHFFIGEIDGDRGSRGHTFGISVGRERAGIINGVVWVEVLKIFPFRADKHVAHEKSVVGTSADNSDLDPVFLVPSCKTVDDVNSVSCVEIINSTFTVDSPNL
jgi:hypothetical protein